MGDSQSVDGRTELLLDLRESRHRQQEEHRDDTGWETAIKIRVSGSMTVLLLF